MDIADDEPTAFPRRRLCRIPEEIENIVRDPIERGHDLRWPVIFAEELLEALPIEWVDFRLSCVEPRDVLVPDQRHADVHGDGDLGGDAAEDLREFVIGNRECDAEASGEVSDLHLRREAVIGKRHENGAFD